MVDRLKFPQAARPMRHRDRGEVLQEAPTLLDEDHPPFLGQAGVMLGAVAVCCLPADLDAETLFNGGGYLRGSAEARKLLNDKELLLVGELPASSHSVSLRQATCARQRVRLTMRQQGGAGGGHGPQRYAGEASVIVPRNVLLTSWIRRSSRGSVSPKSTHSSWERYTGRSSPGSNRALSLAKTISSRRISLHTSATRPAWAKSSSRIAQTSAASREARASFTPPSPSATAGTPASWRSSAGR